MSFSKAIGVLGNDFSGEVAEWRPNS